MEYARNRKHPRLYKKNAQKNEETILSLSGAAAAGILTGVFANGMLLGYLISRKLSQR